MLAEREVVLGGEKAAWSLRWRSPPCCKGGSPTRARVWHDATMKRALETVFVVGMGEVGRRLAAALKRAGVRIVPVTREQGWDAAISDAAGLRLVCVREEALPTVLDRLRSVHAARLAFVQNGWLREALAPAGGCTRGLIWFTSKVDFFRELRSSPFSGPAAEPLAVALTAGGLHATAVEERVFRGLDAEKMGFNCVVGLPLAVHGVTLGEYLENHAEEAKAVFTEATAICAATLGVEAEPGWWGTFLKVAQPLGWVRASSARALEYRNGAVVRLAGEVGLRAPVNGQLLRLAGFAG
jgi:ketopantoate reductase